MPKTLYEILGSMDDDAPIIRNLNAQNQRAGRHPNPDSQRERAKKMGVSRSTLRRWDNGAKPRKPAVGVEVCERVETKCEVIYE
jgi:transcriptional regulator with XRE-family HTH domain